MRKATPAKSGAGAKASARAKPARLAAAAKQTKRAPQPKPAKGKARAAAPAKKPAKKTAPAKSAKTNKTKSAAAKPQPKKGSAPAAKARPSRSVTASKPVARPAAKPVARPAGVLIEQHARVSEVTARARTYLAIAEARLRTESSLPRDPDSLYDRGVIELNRGDFVAAQEMFERSLKRDPDASDTHYALAASRARLGAVVSALQALARAVELKPVLRVRAQSDSDLVSLRNEPDFERIVFGTSRA
ncbi:MAG: tetratricopeptide repeat protein [Acidobacteria bacterium]|nr:tetratricopeptide repeat protein [Acidobacteriota bacterium]